MRTWGKKQMMVHSDGKEFLVDLIGSYDPEKRKSSMICVGKTKKFANK
jgi:hypothetical protein